MPTMSSDSITSAFGALRVTQHEHEVRELHKQFPMLSRTEIADVIQRAGPMRLTVEAELGRISRGKR